MDVKDNSILLEEARIKVQLKYLPSSVLQRVIKDSREFNHKALWIAEDTKRRDKGFKVTDSHKIEEGY